MFKSSLKGIVLVVMSFMMFAVCSCFADSKVGGYVNLQSVVSDDEATSQISIYLKSSICENFGWTAFSATSKNWSESYGGLFYSPVCWLELSANVGIETADDPLRKAVTVWTGSHYWSILSINEDGGSGFWYDDIAINQWTDFLGVGFRAQTGLGFGPHFEFALTKQLKLRSSYFVGELKNYLLVEGRMNF